MLETDVAKERINEAIERADRSKTMTSLLQTEEPTNARSPGNGSGSVPLALAMLALLLLAVMTLLLATRVISAGPY